MGKMAPMDLNVNNGDDDDEKSSNLGDASLNLIYLHD